MNDGAILRKYGVQTTIPITIYEVDGVDLRTDWTPAAADCEVMKDEGASTQCTNTATDEGSTFSIVLTATEMQAARITLKIVDAATKVFLDTTINIETYGHALAMHAFDLDDNSLNEALIMQVTTIATLASQTSFTLAAGSTDNDAYNGATVMIVDASTGVQKAFGSISDYVGSTKTVTLAQDPGIFVMAVSDKVYVITSDVFAILDRDLTGATHNVLRSMARRMRNIQDFGIYDMASVWVDESGGASSGTTNGEDATVTNRADDLDNAVTIAASVGLDKIHIQSGNSITLTGALNGYDVWGRLYTIALGGQSIAGTTFCWATISGIGTGSNPEFCYSTIGTVTLPPARFMYCSYTGTFTMSTAGAYRFIRGESGVAGANAPIWIKTSGQTITGEWRDYKGSITVTGLESGDVLTICGTLGTITLNGADASVEIRGTYKSIVNNLTGSPTVNLDGAILAADVATILEGLVLQVTTIATLASQTSFTLSAGSADDDAYGGATIIIVDASTGVQKAFGSISSYTGTSKTVTLAQDPGIFTMATSDKVYIVPSDVFAIWDRLLTGGTHNINNSAAKRAREASGKAIDSGTAQAGTVNTITLATGASSMDGAYDPSMIAIVVGTGMGQSRLIFQYDGTTKVAAVDRNWKVNPDNTSEYVIYANPGREHVNEGLAQAGATATITLNALASGTNDSYVGQIIFIRSGTGEDQARIVIAYNGTTKVATVQKDWYATPDNTSGYVMLPMQVETTDEIATAFYEHATAGHTAAGTFGKVFNDMLADTNEIQGKLPTNKFMGSSDGADDDGSINNIKTQTNAIEVDTQNIQGRLPASLVSGKMNADTTAISGSTDAADKAEASFEVIETGAAEAGTLSTTEMTTDLSEATDDHYNGRVIIWTSGVLLRQATNITDYVGATGKLTYSAVTEAPSAADTFVII